LASNLKGPCLIKGRITRFGNQNSEASNILLIDDVATALDVTVSADIPTIRLAENEWVQPGYKDDHIHVMSVLASLCSVNVSFCETIPELMQTLAEAESSDGEWLRVWGYDDALLRERRHPTREELDQVTGDTPTVLHHRTGHVAVANSAALLDLGVPNSSSEILVERHDLLSKVPRLSLNKIQSAASKMFQQCEEDGVVSVTDATHTNNLDSLELLDSLFNPAISPNLVAMVGAENLDGLSYGKRFRNLSVGHAKVMPDISGKASISHLVEQAHIRGFPTAVHSMDIDTLNDALLAFADSPAPELVKDRIEHCSLALPEQLDLLSKLNIAVSTQPSFLVYREQKYLEQLTSVERKWLWPLRSLLERGVEVTLSSDSPVVPCKPEEWIKAASQRSLNGDESVSEKTARRHSLVQENILGLSAEFLIVGANLKDEDKYRRLDQTLLVRSGKC
jgi:predicted amidohydrolase YtcJ|tara:strand:- start:5236 stop:6588 length:1353 start_codon:yes stop_codon:yes gene_type:complete